MCFPFVVQEREGVRQNGDIFFATLFNLMWPRIVADPSTLGRHVAATCMLCMQTLCLWRGRATACRTLSHKLQCAHQSLKIMVSYGNKYPRHNARPHVVEQSGQCARALRDKHLIISISKQCIESYQFPFDYLSSNFCAFG